MDRARGHNAGVMEFVRCNLGDLSLTEGRVHGGDGAVRMARIADAAAFAGGAHFLEYVELPPGASIGRHRGKADAEELCLVLEGRGTMFRDGQQFTVRTGDVIHTTPGGEHGLRNTGTGVMRLFVVELRACP